MTTGGPPQQGYPGPPQQGYPGPPQQSYPPPPQYQPGPVQPRPKNNGFAVASLVLSLLWLFWLGSLLAVIFGHIALSQIKKSGELGYGFAIAGLVLGYIGLGLLVLALLIG